MRLPEKLEKLKVAAFEDGAFHAEAGGRGKKALLLGVLMENFRVLDIALTLIAVDGLDATEKLVEQASRWKGKLNLLMLASIAYAGFNLVDPEEASSRLGVPVLVVLSRKPRKTAVRRALKRHFPDWELRVKIVEKAESFIPVKLPGGQAYIAAFGLRGEEALETVKGLTVFGGRPEPLRAAKLLVRGLGFWPP